MFKKIGHIIKTGFRKIKEGIKSIPRIMTTPFKSLSFLQGVFKVLAIGLGLYIGLMVFLFVIGIIAIAYLIGSVIFSFGGAIENGTNEALGRNRRRY